MSGRDPWYDMTPAEREKFTLDAYCENEATYGYYCDRPDCPHCPYYKAQEGRWDVGTR